MHVEARGLRSGGKGGGQGAGVEVRGQGFRDRAGWGDQDQKTFCRPARSNLRRPPGLCKTEIFLQMALYMS